MSKTRYRIRLDLAALGFLGICVAGLTGATLPDFVAGLSGTQTQSDATGHASGVMPGAPIGRILARIDSSAAAVRKDVQSLSVDRPLNAAAVRTIYRDLGYALPTVREQNTAVPRLFLASVPGDLKGLSDSNTRKSLFLRTLLPLVLKVNEEIAADRMRLTTILNVQTEGRVLSSADKHWLDEKSREYGLQTPSARKLLSRMDAVPVSMALAQAAEESGWGTSRFARQGNALFGQWTQSESAGIVPRNRPEGATHAIKAFPTLIDAVRAYARNLNSHRAYAEFRSRRDDLRRAGQPLNGWALARTLTRYSERGQDYVDTLHIIMKANDLTALDDAQLSTRPIEVASLENSLPSLR